MDRAIEKDKSGLLSKAKRIKLIACDMDGTLLNSKLEVSRRTLETINRLTDRGMRFTICTGREYAMMDHYSRILKLKTPMICNNGAEVVQSKTGEVIYREPLPKEQSIDFLKFCMAHKIDYCASTISGCYFPVGSKMTEFYDAYEAQAKKEGIRPFPVAYVESAQMLDSMVINKIVMRNDLPGFNLAKAYLDNEESLEFTTSSQYIQDILPSKMDKAVGLKKLADYYGIAMEDCCVIGDFINDSRMFKEAGLAIAMGNALETLKKQADYITDTNDCDGVAKAVELLFLD